MTGSRGETPGLEISSLLDVSTKYCTEQDMRALAESASREGPDYGVVAYDTPYGAFLLVEYAEDDPFSPEGQEREWSPGFIHVVRLAQAAGCRWVKWDQDGGEIPDAETYEW